MDLIAKLETAKAARAAARAKAAKVAADKAAFKAAAAAALAVWDGQQGITAWLDQGAAIYKAKDSSNKGAGRWTQMRQRHGDIEAVALAVLNRPEYIGERPWDEDLKKWSCESCVLVFPDNFAPEVVAKAKQSLGLAA